MAERLSDLGIDIYAASITQGAAIEEMGSRIATGALRVLEHLEPWFAEYRRYRRDDKDQVIDLDDHLMRATGLVLVYGLDMAISENRAMSHAEEFDPVEYDRISGALGPTGY